MNIGREGKEGEMVLVDLGNLCGMDHVLLAILNCEAEIYTVAIFCRI